MKEIGRLYINSSSHLLRCGPALNTVAGHISSRAVYIAWISCFVRNWTNSLITVPPWGEAAADLLPTMHSGGCRAKGVALCREGAFLLTLQHRALTFIPLLFPPPSLVFLSSTKQRHKREGSGKGHCGAAQTMRKGFEQKKNLYYITGKTNTMES